MLNQELMDFLQTETVWNDLENQNLLHEFPQFGKEVGEAIHCGELLPFSKELSEQLGSMDLYKAILLSNFIGFVCEQTEDTTAGHDVITFFSHACILVYELFQYIEENENESILEDKEALYHVNSEWAKAYYGFNTLCISTMAFLSRDADLRATLLAMDISEQTQYLAQETSDTPYLHSIHYVDAMQYTCSNLNLLVLYPQRKKGFFATANDLKNCFHLLFLLEEQMNQKLCSSYGMTGYSADASLVRLAHGEYPDDCWGKSYSTYFMECDYRSAFCTKEELAKERMIPLIWGEMPPNYIPSVDNYAVIVLWENGIHRSFSGEFMAVDHPALKPYVRIEKELTEAEYHTWLQKIKDKAKE